MQIKSQINGPLKTIKATRVKNDLSKFCGSSNRITLFFALCMRKCSNQFSSLQKWGKVWYEEVCNKALWLSVVFLWRFPVCCCLHVCHRVYLSSRPPQWHLSKKTMLPWLTQTFTFKAKEVSASVTLFLQCCMPHSKDVLNSSLKKSIYILGTRAKGKTAHLRRLHIQVHSIHCSQQLTPVELLYVRFHCFDSKMIIRPTRDNQKVTY